jgi:hypothetical protein
MSKENHLKFSADGKEVQIVFKDGKESIYYTSKKEFAKALDTLAGAQRIAKEEVDPLLKEVAAAENMPFSSQEEQHSHQPSGIGGLIAMLALGSIFGGIGINGAALTALMEDDEPVEVALFKMCDCGKHAKILSREAKATPLFSKADSREAADQMEKRSYITANEKIAILAQIDASTLPEGEAAKKNESASTEAVH